MNLKEKTAILGLGCYGGKQAKEFISTYGYKGSAANGSDQDLKALGGSIPKYHLEGFDGFGGHRDKALECLQENGEFLDYVEAIKEQIVFLIFAGGGSTGSGCAPIVAELLMQKPGRIVCPVIALPSSDEAIDKHSNAYQAVQELQELDGLGATFFINNDVERDYDNINTTFAKLLDTFLTNDSYGERNNFDESERLEMLRDSGAMVLSLHKSGTDQTAMVDKLIRNGIFAPIEDTQVVEHIAVIHSGNNNSDLDTNMLISDIGKPRNVFEGYNGRSTLIAASGLDFPVTHVSKLGEIAKGAFEERQRGRKQAKKLGDLSFMDEIKERPAQEKPKKTSKLTLLQRHR